MKLLSMFLNALLLSGSAVGFSPIFERITSNVNSVIRAQRNIIYDKSRTSIEMSAVSDAEEMLRKARELRAQAEADEHQLHQTLLQKKGSLDEETDKIIEEIFPIGLPRGQAGVWKIADNLQTRKFSASCLERVVGRLHEREIAAKGLSHVEPSLHHTHVKFEKVAVANEEESKRVEGLIQMLIDAAAVLDDKVLGKHRGGRVDDHWSSGELSERLEKKAHFLGREHDDQFKGRLEEYYEAARKKKKHDNHDRGENTRIY